MDLAQTEGLDFSEIVVRLGTDSSTRGRVFIINREDGDNLREYSYEDLYRKSLEYGNMIYRVREEQGKGDSHRFHVGVFMQNRPEFFFILGACAFTNSTLVGINNAQIGEKLAFDINNIDIDMLIADDGIHPGTRRTFAETAFETGRKYGFKGLADDYILSLGKTDEKIGAVDKLLGRYRDSLPDFTIPRLETRQPAVIIFTSGTTSAPKGIEVTWEKLIDVGINCTKILDYGGDDVGYVCMPLNHSNSLYLNVMPALMNGARIMIRRRFSSSNFVKDLRDSGATVWNSVGDPVHYVLNYLEHEYEIPDFSDLPLRTVISTGASSIDRKSFSRIFRLDIFTEIYGSTEAGAVTAVDEGTPDYSVGRLIKDVRIIKEGSAGHEVDYAVVDALGRIMNLDEAAGEIIVSQRSLGSSAFTGYYKLEEENTRQIVRIGGEDFYRMGDIGAIIRKNDDKYLIFLGRAGDWIRFKGENWVPVDAEMVAMKHPGVRNAGVIGLPQSIGKEDDPMFIIEPVNLQTFDVDDFYEYLREKVPHYMLPRFIRLKASLPMTETMKLIKARLKHDFIYRSPEIDEDPDDVIYEILRGKAQPFTTADYLAEIEKYADPTNRDRLIAFTKRDILFKD